MKLTPRTRALLILAAICLATTGMVALAMAAVPNTGKVYSVAAQPTQPTLAPPPTASTLAPASSSTIAQAPGSTTADPNTFTTGTMPGPIQVKVQPDAACRPGQGYEVRYTLSNDGPPVVGPVTAQLDLQDPVVIKAATGLGPGQQESGTILLPGTGELVTVTWQGRTSFPMEVQPCPRPAGEERAASSITTSP